MELKDVKIGTRFEIEILDSYAEKSNTTYVSQLLEYAKNMSMIVSTPIYESRLVYMPMDSLVRVYFLHQKQGFLSFTAKLNYKGTRGKISVMGLTPNSGLEKLQRRKHYRLDSLLGVEYVTLESTGIPSSDKWKKGIFKNISASGSCLLAEEALEKGTDLKFKLSITSTIQVSAVASVVRHLPVENKSIKKFEHGLIFTEISDRDQDKLIKYIFEQQRLQLNKETR